MNHILALLLAMILAFGNQMQFDLPTLSAGIQAEEADESAKRDTTLNIAKTELGASKEAVDATNEWWKLVPQNIRQHFIESGWSLIVSGEELSLKTKTYKPGYTMDGVTFYKRKIVYIGNYVESPGYALLHEMGHYLDYSYGYISDSKEFQKIYKEEAKNHHSSSGDWVTGYATESPREYFADVFDLAIKDPETCKKNTPKTYGFIMTLAITR